MQKKNLSYPLQEPYKKEKKRNKHVTELKL